MNEAPVHEASSHVTSPFSWMLKPCAPGERPRMLAVMTTISWLDLLRVVSNLTEPATSLPLVGTRSATYAGGGLANAAGVVASATAANAAATRARAPGRASSEGGIAEDARHPARTAGAGERDAGRASARSKGALVRAESAAGVEASANISNCRRESKCVPGEAPRRPRYPDAVATVDTANACVRSNSSIDES